MTLNLETFPLGSLEIYKLNEAGKWQSSRHENIFVVLEKSETFQLRFFAPPKHAEWSQASSDFEIDNQSIFVLDLESVQVKIILDDSTCLARWGPIPPGWSLKFTFLETQELSSDQMSLKFELALKQSNLTLIQISASRLQKFTQKPSVIPEPTVFSQPSSIPQPDIFSQPNLISQPCSTSQPTFFSQPNIISQPNIFSQPNFTPQPNVVTSNEPDDERELRLHLEEVLSSKHFPEYELQVSAYLTGSGRVDPDLAASVNRCLMNDRDLINKMKIILIKKMKNSSS